MSWALGIDTSNYTTSVAAYNLRTGQVIQAKKKLPVKQGELGLRQSDAVFAHTQQLGGLIEEIMRQVETLVAVGVSVRPREKEGSYMPCFLVGRLAARSIAAALKLPTCEFSHQAGHIGAVLYDTNNHHLLDQSFIAFHISGGTTESVYVSPGSKHTFEITSISNSTDLYAGQAVDRIGRTLDLSFPAGSALEELALKSDKSYSPKPYFKEGNPSISGLENQCNAMLDKGEKREDIARFCIDWLAAMVDEMTVYAKSAYPNLPVIYAGGVMSNQIIKDKITAKHGGYFAKVFFSEDNAAGTAFLAGERYKKDGINC